MHGLYLRNNQLCSWRSAIMMILYPQYQRQIPMKLKKKKKKVRRCCTICYQNNKLKNWVHNRKSRNCIIKVVTFRDNCSDKLYSCSPCFNKVHQSLVILSKLLLLNIIHRILNSNTKNIWSKMFHFKLTLTSLIKNITCRSTLCSTRLA